MTPPILARLEPPEGCGGDGALLLRLLDGAAWEASIYGADAVAVLPTGKTVMYWDNRGTEPK